VRWRLIVAFIVVALLAASLSRDVPIFPPAFIDPPFNLCSTTAILDRARPR
jgi:hypothetical protein